MKLSEIAPGQMKDVLGHFCSGITVITAMSPDGPVGFTCQSFSSLSLDPPLVTFSPARSSTTWPKIREIGSFVVNVLAEDHDQLSNGFAKSGADKFAGVDWTESISGAPVLDGVVAWADCSLWAEYDGGDHTIVAASVSDLRAYRERSPLLYYRGAYHLIDRHPRHPGR
ncbi:flavin reductase family protein [Rhodococcus sp. 114MFTsu3.1]|uniref:flavin reductase family protein n=1 Tax=Rhodococcus sp. 114MFTsu3.1 TaxID=1172184 RepID=UPI0003A9141A|nr:flavin reductase family protein [Rhodococcus sp. 114MFTsu3.1]